VPLDGCVQAALQMTSKDADQPFTSLMVIGAAAAPEFRATLSHKQ